MDCTEAEEAAEWLVDVGLGDVLDGLMENGRQLAMDKLWSSLTQNQGFNRNQVETVKRRVETVRSSLKPARHQRRDCRDIFRDADQVMISCVNPSLRSLDGAPVFAWGFKFKSDGR